MRLAGKLLSAGPLCTHILAAACASHNLAGDDVITALCLVGESTKCTNLVCHLSAYSTVWHLAGDGSSSPYLVGRNAPDDSAGLKRQVAVLVFPSSSLGFPMSLIAGIAARQVEWRRPLGWAGFCGCHQKCGPTSCMAEPHKCTLLSIICMVALDGRVWTGGHIIPITICTRSC